MSGCITAPTTSTRRRPNRYTIIRAQFDKWFSSKVREAGAVVLCETTVTELVQDAYGKVIGVRTDRPDGEVHADVVVLAEGVNGLLGTRAELRERPKPENVALAVKEMHFLPREDDRGALQSQGRRRHRDRGRRHHLAAA